MAKRIDAEQIRTPIISGVGQFVSLTLKHAKEVADVIDGHLKERVNQKGASSLRTITGDIPYDDGKQSAHFHLYISDGQELCPSTGSLSGLPFKIVDSIQSLLVDDGQGLAGHNMVTFNIEEYVEDGVNKILAIVTIRKKDLSKG